MTVGRTSTLDLTERQGGCLRSAESAVVNLLEALGVELPNGDLEDTARRVAATYRELLTPRPFDATSFPNDAGYDELVLARGIRFTSLCRRHLLPFHGIAHVGYLPGERILGLSKLARAVDYFARALQLQQQLTKQIADWLEDELSPRGVGVVLEAEHLCTATRGVEVSGTKTFTSAMYGLLRENPSSRAEFLALVGFGNGRKEE